MLILRSALMLATCVVIGSMRGPQPSEPGDVAYPDGFRQWVHIRTGFGHRDSAGVKRLDAIHNIYANAAAMQGYASGGGHFPQGAVIAVEFISVTATNGTHTPGSRRHVDVMAKDTLRFASTGGWGFNEFRGDTREQNAGALVTCAGCHASQRDHDYVFSQFKP